MDIAIKTVENYSQEIVTEFLEGNHFELRLSRKVITGMDFEDQHTYDQIVFAMKRFLSEVDKEQFLDLYIVTDERELTVKEKAVMIRLINMCHKERNYFIIYNEEIIYYPQQYSDRAYFEITKYVSSTLKILNARKKAFARHNKVKESIRGFFNKGEAIDTDELNGEVA